MWLLCCDQVETGLMPTDIPSVTTSSIHNAFRLSYRQQSKTFGKKDVKRRLAKIRAVQHILLLSFHCGICAWRRHLSHIHVHDRPAQQLCRKACCLGSQALKQEQLKRCDELARKIEDSMSCWERQDSVCINGRVVRALRGQRCRCAILASAGSERRSRNYNTTH